MRAIVVDRWMEPADLRVREAPEPELAPGTLAVEVRAAGCNFFDLLMVRGQYQVRPPFPFVPGAELAGVVREIGAGVEASPSATGSSPRRRSARSPSARQCPRSRHGACRRRCRSRQA